MCSAVFFSSVGQFLLRLVVFFILTTGLVAPLPKSVFGNQRSHQTTAFQENKKLYTQAKDTLHALQQAPAHEKDRLQWLKGVRNFRRIYLRNTRGPLAPACLYMIARMYRQMFQRFHQPIDLDESINSYQQLASRFADNRLADDALFAVATLYEREKKDTERAMELYKKIISRYPQGDQCANARKKLAGLARHGRIVPAGSQSGLSGVPLADIFPVKHWSSADYTRIVIQASRPVSYTTSLLEKDGDQPRRLYVDLQNSTIAPRFQAPVPIEDGLLKRVRTGQFNDNTVRVVLDIESISDYKIFDLKDPFKIVIDVHGIKTGKTVAAPKATSPVPELPKTKPKVETTAPVPSIIVLEDISKKRPRHRSRAHRQPPATIRQAQQSRFSLAQQLGLGIRKIIIDPGHGGKDPGAMAFGLKEKDIVLKVAKKVGKLLRKKYNYEVSLTRKTDIFIPLEERTALANTTGADLFVSIHVNAHPNKATRGIETFYLNLATNGEAMRVAARENATSTHNISEMQH
ncbi:MAG TPA: N-acetylmuramoyl-L-alanine amidase, partial [Desulfobulbus sp.]|nr:N-acetylmuramoyl-L-alanine amidase [Desulfobulbus sp.]